jgi:methyl coenzyme M reductase subunit C-like uncharacterized protein (methanogenesis marker protein 7)
VEFGFINQIPKHYLLEAQFLSIALPRPIEGVRVMLNWDQHFEKLSALYMTEEKSLSEIKEYMESNHSLRLLKS